jgi:GTP-binding protein
LIDARRGVTTIDFEFMEFLDEISVPYQIILTKVDQVSKGEYEKISGEAKNEAKNHKSLEKEILFSSSKKGYGLDRVREVIYSILKIH